MLCEVAIIWPDMMLPTIQFNRPIQTHLTAVILFVSTQQDWYPFACDLVKYYTPKIKGIWPPNGPFQKKNHLPTSNHWFSGRLCQFSGEYLITRRSLCTRQKDLLPTTLLATCSTHTSILSVQDPLFEWSRSIEWSRPIWAYWERQTILALPSLSRPGPWEKK